jgi:beta-1,4-mannosyl-glycoprotein beta-1,4-N-acetylglucosaminyltransferase
MENGGWHFNYLGGAANIILKIQAYAHQEFNTTELLNMNTIHQRMMEKKDVLGRLYQYEVIPINEQTVPKYILDNLKKFDYMIYREP